MDSARRILLNGNLQVRHPRKTRDTIQRLIRASLGEIKADLILTGGRLINVYTGEVLDGVEIAASGGRICYVGSSAAHTRGEETRIIDARGRWIAPGFVDAHTHIGHFCRPFELLQAYLPHGATALMASCDEHTVAFGPAGMKLFLDEVACHPLRVYTLISMAAPQDPLLCRTESLSDQEVADALRNPRVLGLGEVVSWLRLVQGDPEVLARIDMALGAGKIVHGHTAGARDRRLNAIAAASVSSCHEPISGRDALERLRLGYWTMLREGSFRQDLEATLKPLLAAGVDTGRLILVTDGMAPDDVAAGGHMDHVIRRAVECGLSPVRAIQAITLHPATYSGLEQDIGGLAPGRFADFVLLDDLETVRVGATFIGGELVAESGESKVDAVPPTFPGDMGLKTAFRLPVTADDMRIRCENSSARVRVMDLVNQTITRERIVDVACVGGVIPADVESDLLKVAVFDRREGFSPAFGFIRGLRTDIGAVGTTVNLDEYTLMVAGSSDYDMAYCANLLLESGGGVALVDKGQVLQKIPFSIGGLFSLEPWRDVGHKLEAVQRILKDRGAPFPKPLYALCFLTFVTLPELRITGRGLVRAKERRIVPLLAE